MTTTDYLSDLVRRPADIRLKIAEAATEGYQRADQLTDLVQELAGAEAISYIAAEVLNHIDAGEAYDIAMAEMIQRQTRRMLMTGADDNWSGRGNDTRRAAFDAVRGWLLELTVAANR